ncbi:MAG: AAA family ATPase [Planctomycetota bacterium]
MTGLRQEDGVEPRHHRVARGNLTRQHELRLAFALVTPVARLLLCRSLQHRQTEHRARPRRPRLDGENALGEPAGVGVALARDGEDRRRFVADHSLALFLGQLDNREPGRVCGLRVRSDAGARSPRQQHGDGAATDTDQHARIIVWPAPATKLRFYRLLARSPGNPMSEDIQARAKTLISKVEALRGSLHAHVIGQEQVIDDLLVALMAGGHVLLEGLPGLGKTLLVRTLAHCLGLDYSRIQFTPDLMPSDVTGTQVIDDSDGRRQFRFQPGPIFAGLVLADEINRATPKTQSALLEAMQEGSVTVAGTTHRLPTPFHVVATQNPIELEGTFPLPEAQLDRFLFRLDVRPPTAAAMTRILDATTGAAIAAPRQQLTSAELGQLQQLVRQVLCGSHLVAYVAELVVASHPDHPDSDEPTRRFVRYGASARAGQAVLLGAKARALLAGRPAVVQEDIDACLSPALRHRVLLGFEADAQRITVETLLPAWKTGAQRRLR